jgi:hypothetical protein
MSTPRFAAGIHRLERLADEASTVIMCAEANPEACVASSRAKWLPAVTG